MYNSILHGLIRNSGLTQHGFAEIIGIHPTQMSLIICGDIQRIGWKPETVQRHLGDIAKYFDQQIEDIFHE